MSYVLIFVSKGYMFEETKSGSELLAHPPHHRETG